MNRSIKRITSGILTMAVVASMGVFSAFADGPREDGNYTAKLAMLHETQEQNSMCNVLFDHDVDVIVKGSETELKVYAAYPVPAFSSMGTDGTLKNMIMTLDGTQYTAVSDITSKPMRTMDETNSGFGVEAGKSISTQVLTFSIPTEKLDAAFAAPVPTTAFVNVVMNSDMNFRMQLTDLKDEASPVQPDETKTQSMQVTANVAAPAASYTVTIPGNVSLGTLSADKDNVVAYDVSVTAENLGAGYVQVSADAAGELTSKENKLAFSNDFKTQKATGTSTLKGNFTVAAKDVKAAAAGDYTGTANFNISYFAEK